jgi:Gpi18-like mannosyltransferase
MALQLRSWDGAWYLDVARHGYPHSVPTLDGHAAQSTIAFFPLFPLLVRAVAALPGVSYLAAGVAVATVCGLVACLLIWHIAALVADREAADRAVALFAFFPGSFVLSLPYSESLMLVLAAACLLFLLQRRWLGAGVAAALATATRPNAVVLVACCTVPAIAALHHRTKDWRRALIAVALAPVGILTFFAFLAARTGTKAAWFRVQHDGWGERMSLTGTWQKVHFVLHHGARDANLFLTVMGTLFVVVALVAMVRNRQPVVLVAYTIGILGLALLSRTLGARPRFVLTAFPLFIALAARLRPRAYGMWLAASAGLLGSLTILSLAAGAFTP